MLEHAEVVGSEFICPSLHSVESRCSDQVVPLRDVGRDTELLGEVAHRVIEVGGEVCVVDKDDVVVVTTLPRID